MKLRPIEPEDLDFLYTIENDAEMWDSTDSDAPYSRYALKRYVAASSSVYASGELRLVVEVDDETAACVPVGTVQLSEFVPLAARAEVGIAMLREYRRRGYGLRALALLERIAVERLRIHTLYAVVAVTNEASQSLFRQSGYRESACLTDWLYAGGRYVDALLYTKVFQKK